MDENEISGQIRKWLSSMQDLSNSAFQSDDLEELFDEEVWISDHFNNHAESSIQSGKVDGILLQKEDLRHNFKTEGFLIQFDFCPLGPIKILCDTQGIF